MKEFEVLKKMVGFNTIKDHQNKEILDYLESILKEKGFRTISKTKNLIMQIGANSKLGFLGHTDTVEYIEEFKNPFELIQKGEYLYGLGSCDMKGGIAAMIDTALGVDFSKLKYGMTMYFTYDEEITFKGVQELVDQKVNFPEYMIFGEPTDNKVFVGSKGLLEYEIYFEGLKAHSSNPNKGISANLNAVNFLYELQEFYNKDIKPEKFDVYEVPFTTMNVGLINGGSAKNSVPASCNISIDFRLADSKHIDVIVNKIEELSKKYKAKVNIIECIKPFADKIDFLKDAKAANFITEASKVTNCNNRIILGVGPVTAHEVNEHISIESYNKLKEQYKELIYKICK